MALEVISDPGSEAYRNRVSEIVITALGGDLDQGLWVLRLRAAEGGGSRVTLERGGDAVVEVRVSRMGRRRRREVEEAFAGAIGSLRSSGGHGVSARRR